MEEKNSYLSADPETIRPVSYTHLAPEILKACGVNDEETGVIVTAISRHRDPEAAKEKNLNGILYRADKASRACFACEAEKDCNWKDGKKNLTIKY